MGERDDTKDDGPKDDEDRKAILARRNRLIAIAFSGLTGAAGCYESHVPGEPPRPRRDGGVDAAIPGVCLGAPLMDAGFPGPCLEAPFDAGPSPFDATPGPCLDFPIPDAEPTPCLDTAPWDAGDDDPDPFDAGPGPCLSAPTPGS